MHVVCVCGVVHVWSVYVWCVHVCVLVVCVCMMCACVMMCVDLVSCGNILHIEILNVYICMYRYERSNSQQHPGVTHHDSTNNNDSNNNGSSGSGSHTSSSSSTPAGNSLSLGSTKNRGKVKKIISDLGEGLEVLHSEPSGWGDLPSPKETDLDNGTEYWGIPPIDLKRLKEGSRTGPPSRPSSEHHAGECRSKEGCRGKGVEL